MAGDLKGLKVLAPETRHGYGCNVAASFSRGLLSKEINTGSYKMRACLQLPDT